MKQYLDLLQNILNNGVEKESGRENMPNTIGLSHSMIEMNLTDGFPLLTTKKMFLKGVIYELLWFLKGDTNIKYLVDNGVNIWNGDAYRWYLKNFKEQYGEPKPDIGSEPISQKEFIKVIKENDYPFEPNQKTGYMIGDLGKVYGHQWRDQHGVDQINDVINGLRDNPYSRYHIIDSWNKADFPDMALPPCHLLYQFIVRPMTAVQREDEFAKINEMTKDQRMEMNPNATDEDVHQILDEQKYPKFYLDLNMYQRSCDTFLGVPFNIASMSLLLTIMAEVSNMVPGMSRWIGGDTHLYKDHIPMVEEQLSRKPFKLPQLYIARHLNNFNDIMSLTIEDFILTNYNTHPTIKAELFTGLKK